jgi:hypothetical protein
MSDTHRIWSWSPTHRMWMEVDQGSERDMKDRLERRRDAAARLMPSARFVMTSMKTSPTGPPDDDE